MLDTLYQRYADPMTLLENIPWRHIPRFIDNLARETQEEKVDAIWLNKDIEAGWEEYRKDVWKRAKYSRQGNVKMNEEILRRKEKQAGFVSIEVEGL